MYQFVRFASVRSPSWRALALGLMLGGCFTQTYQRGYVLADGALEQIPLGAPQEQVLITLGTPSTVATVSGEVFYYISARTEQTSFLPEKTVDQRVVAVYFDKNRRVQRVANYGLRGRPDLRLRQPHHADQRARNSPT